jgi:hypothetical protein
MTASCPHPRDRGPPFGTTVGLKLCSEPPEAVPATMIAGEQQEIEDVVGRC